MMSCDTNVLFAAVNPDDANHAIACEFLNDHANDSNFVLAEQVLVELYALLRNPTIQRKPLSAKEAVAVVGSFRRNPSWAIVDVPSDPSVMGEVWHMAARQNFARRRIHDVRLGMTLKYWNVDEFYTRNVRDFGDVGFQRLADPFANKGKKRT